MFMTEQNASEVTRKYPNMVRSYLCGPDGGRHLVGLTNHRSGLSLAMSFVTAERLTSDVCDFIRERVPGWDGAADKKEDRVEFPGGWVLVHG